MRQILFITLGAILTVSLIVFGFTYNQANEERLDLSADLQYRTRLLADSLKEAVEPSYSRNSTGTLQRIVDRFTDRERIVGLAVFNNRGIPLAASKDIPTRVTENPDFVFAALDKNEASGAFETIDGASRYLFVAPLHDGATVVGALIAVQDASYIDATVADIWKRNIVRLLVQILVFSVAIVLLIRWALLRIMKRFAESIKSARINKEHKTLIRGPFFLNPVASEIAKMYTSLAQARFAASEEARMRLEKLDSPWTAERLKEFVKAQLKDRNIYIAFNREPYTHTKIKNEIRVSSPAGGASTALESIMEACGGMWIAHGSGTADKNVVDERDTIAVPPDNPKYTLKRLWLTKSEVSGFYKGFSTEGLLPLCLMTHTRPVFRKEDWVSYVKVNRKYAQTLLGEIRDVEQPIILVNDYHLALLPRLIKEARPDARVGLFWHIPWPSMEQFSICPWRKDILDGMLGADVIGFNTQQFCNNFIDTVGKELESLVDLEQFSVTRATHISHIRSFPISVAFTKDQNAEESVPVDKAILERLNIKTPYLGLGVDRLDYTKGIPERFKAVEFFLDAHPEYRGTFTFLQIASPTRQEVLKYQEHREAVMREAERINKKIGTNEWKPIVLEVVQYSHPELESLYKLARVCLVTSLHDSMNLVAKEFAAARSDEEGVLVLSQFAGASRDMKGALIVNPYNTEEVANAVYTALTMPRSEQRERMKKMRERVKNYNVYRWAAEFIKAVAELG